MMFALSASVGAAQRVSVITPDDTEGSRAMAVKLESALHDKLRLIDDSMARSAFDASGLKTPFNLTADEGKRLGQAIGCDFVILLRSAVQRRSSFERQEYYEAYAHVFLVSTRTGRLVLFTNEKHEADKPQTAAAALDASVAKLAEIVAQKAKQTLSSELNEPPAPEIEEPPPTESPAAKNFKAPVPFRRIKPAYTDEASLYGVDAMVEILVDLSSDGRIMRTEVTRWAGYGLDESAIAAIKAMNWRPAERDGRFLPMRFLVRYNFKKPEKS